VLVNGGVEVGAELVGSGPELFVELAEEWLGRSEGHWGGSGEARSENAENGKREFGL
jgi:hypothetical protein